MEKVQWNSIDKKHNGLKYSKNDKSSTLPRLHNQCFNYKGRIFLIELVSMINKIKYSHLYSCNSPWHCSISDFYQKFINHAWEVLGTATAQSGRQRHPSIMTSGWTLSCQALTSWKITLIRKYIYMNLLR